MHAQFCTDIPSESWLQEQIDYAQSRPRNQYGVPHMGKLTGYWQGKPCPAVPVSVLASLRGQRGEQDKARPDDLERLKNKISVQGLKSVGVPYVEVGYDGVPWVSEGNHRVMAASALGIETMPVEIRYFDGGERIESGILYPQKVVRFQEVEQCHHLSN